MDMTSKRIVKGYEEYNLSIEDLCLEHNLEPESMKVLLMQYSPKYRSEIGNGVEDVVEVEDPLNFNKQEQMLAKEALLRIMKDSEAENPILVASIAKYVRNDAKGRLDGVHALAGLNLNVNVFNTAIQNAKASRERTLKNGASQPKHQDTIEA